MKNILLRPAKTEDLDFVRQCAERAYEIYVERIGKPPAPMIADFWAALTKQHLNIACLDRSPVGFVVSYVRGDHLFVENVAIHPDHQGQGIAKKLFSLLEQRCKLNGLSSIELYTNEKMTENLTFYPNLGFCETDRRREAGFNRVYFRKTL
ncbi:MAG: GNAT family N-acetyltransferase [Rhizobiaceae bacterium]|nr:GNAT family N-acetyltransferase [Rhizobiaceae bacterium]